ncbi:FxSxx-COOH system tetratricopeptide repeat protein [Streptomyces sp. NPDC001348]
MPPAVRRASGPLGGPGDGRLWNIPSPVRSFVDRKTEMKRLYAKLLGTTTESAVQILTLYGLGGIGKTQLARAYAHRYFKNYRLGWWISAETVPAAEAGLADLALRLGAPADLQTGQLAAHAHSLLAERSEWLLIFDNSTSPSDLGPFLPALGRGHVLITSRNTAWGGVAEPMSVELLPLDAAVELLLLRSGDPDQDSARALAEELGQLSLALEQAAAYCAECRVSLAHYLRIFRTRRADLLTRGRPLAYEGTVDTAFSLLVGQLHDTQPAAVQLLSFCALFAPDQIPVYKILDHPAQLPAPLRDAAADPVDGPEVIGALYRNSLLTPDTDRGESARIHRLVRDIAFDHIPETDRPELVSAAIEVMAALFPNTPGALETRSTCVQLLPHAYSLIVHGSRLGVTTLSFADLLDRVAYYLLVWTTETERASELQEQSLGIRRRIPPLDSPATATCLNGLATAMRHMGNLDRSRELHEQALAMHYRVHPGDHPDTSTTLTDLSFTCSRLEDGESARRYGEDALAMRRRLYRGDHVDIIVSLNDLGVALRSLGRESDALVLHEEALAMARRLYADDHPEAAQSYYELGVTMRLLGDYRQAFEFARKGLEMRERLHPGDHRHTARSLHDLAVTSRLLNQLNNARSLHERALSMRERLHHGDHPETVQSLLELSATEEQSGNSLKAAALKNRALRIQDRLARRDSATPPNHTTDN